MHLLPGTDGLPTYHRPEFPTDRQHKLEQNNDSLVGEDVDGFVHVSQNSLAFQIGPNQGQLRRISVESMNPEELSNGVGNDSNFHSLAEIDVLDADAAQDALLLIDQAIDDVSTMRGNLGSFQKNALTMIFFPSHIASSKKTSPGPSSPVPSH